MKNFLLVALLSLSYTSMAYGQQIINLTSDLVITETLLITEATVYNGNGFRITCEDCDPMIRVEGDIEVRFNNVVFTKNYTSWLENKRGAVYWDGPRMRGKMIWNEVD